LSFVTKIENSIKIEINNMKVEVSVKKRG